MRNQCTRPALYPALFAVSLAAAGASLPAQETQPVGTAPLTTVEPGSSSVRIVRLSQVRGVVQMDRNIGRGFEPAFANIPVVAGARLRTGQGVAEVEFEDNSSLRLAPGTEVTFEQLSRTASGATETAVHLDKGLAYVGLAKTRGNTFSVSDGSARVVLSPGAHVRLDASKPETQLAVFDGDAELEMGGTATPLRKHESVDLNPSTQTVATVVKGTDEGVWDGWDKQENDFHKQKSAFAGSGGSGLYGANDLSYYGSFADLPGCGQVWRPYFASAAWDPFANGAWTLYPGAGYSWVSPYPWGWLPYHSGSWTSCGAAGWGWRPGSSWYGLNNQPVLRLANQNLPHPVPVAPPGRGAASLVPVNTRSLPVSGPTGAEAFTFRRDSAGLGVPRATFGSLHGTSMTMERHGLASHGVAATAFAAPVSPAGAPVGSAAVFGAGQGRSAISNSLRAVPLATHGASSFPGGGNRGSVPSVPMAMPSSSSGMGARAGASGGRSGR